MSTFLQSKTAGAKPRRKMDGGLLCVSETELTSVRLIERAHARALADKLTLAEMMRIWRCIGRVIGASLMLGKGVNVDGLGVFCFDLDGAPMFALQPVGGINWRPQTRQGAPKTIPGALDQSRLPCLSTFQLPVAKLGVLVGFPTSRGCEFVRHIWIRSKKTK